MKKLLYIDLFCGAGGTSTGVNTARLHGEQCAEVIACVNHDANAIASTLQIIRTRFTSQKTSERLNCHHLCIIFRSVARRTLTHLLCYGHRLNVRTSAVQKAVSHVTQTAGHLQNIFSDTSKQ